MESVVRVKKSLRSPIRKLTSCVKAAEEKRLCARRRGKKGRGHRGCNILRKTPPLQASNLKDPSIIRSYQADLDKERKLREALNAQKNAQRAAMRAQFRRKYRLSESPEDTNHLRSVGGKVSLPPELSKMIHPETKTKDDSFNLLSAFQGLSINRAVLTRGKPSRTPTPASAHGDSCRVM
ncbi:complexin-3-like [Girardinichthys multiradiatus]|uniref:complexin-3-like n=1 Tax=Girardinichthys multiradiatus TaxID=208333 RepID=UPI001FAE0131|nr:complexin-3-like [Girardinichthys multiradiatus]